MQQAVTPTKDLPAPQGSTITPDLNKQIDHFFDGLLTAVDFEREKKFKMIYLNYC